MRFNFLFKFPLHLCRFHTFCNQHLLSFFKLDLPLKLYLERSLNITEAKNNNKSSRGEICVANFKAPCKWCKFGQVFNGQLGHLYKLGDWKTAESWPMLKNFWSESFKIVFK